MANYRVCSMEQEAPASARLGQVSATFVVGGGGQRMPRLGRIVSEMGVSANVALLQRVAAAHGDRPDLAHEITTVSSSIVPARRGHLLRARRPDKEAAAAAGRKKWPLGRRAD